MGYLFLGLGDRMRQPDLVELSFLWLPLAIGKRRSNADLTTSYIQITRTQILVILRIRQEDFDILILIPGL